MWTKKVVKGVFTLTAKVRGADLKVTLVEQFEMFKGATVKEYWQAQVIAKKPDPKRPYLNAFNSISHTFKTLAEAQCWCVETTR